MSAGIPVMGHVGLTPQTSTALGGYRAQGRTGQAAARIAREALALQDAGCFSIVFEAMPSAVAAEIMPQMDAVIIGIGAGPSTDGQVLVFHDLLGIREGLGARFVKRYANLQDEMNAGISAFAEDVRSRRYPAPEHDYSIDPAELERSSATRASRGRWHRLHKARSPATTRPRHGPAGSHLQLARPRVLRPVRGGRRRTSSAGPTSSTRCSPTSRTAATSRGTS